MGMGIMKAPPKLAGTATSITLAASQVRGAIPNLPDGTRARYVMVSATIATTIAFGNSAVDATATPQVYLPAGNLPMIFDVTGYTHMSTNSGGAGTALICAVSNQ